MSEIRDDNFRRVPDCPRCGYELRGLPIPGGKQPEGAGQCPECGLVFEWSELLNPLYLAPKWFVEIGHGRLILQSLRTTFHSLFPWKFWRMVQMGFPQHFGRAIACMFIGFVGIWLSVCLIGAMWTILFDSLASQYPWATRLVDSLYTRPFRTLIEIFWPEESGFLSTPWQMTTYIACFAMPIAMQLAPDTLRRAKVLKAHLFRIAIYCVAPVLLTGAIPGVCRALWWLYEIEVRGKSYWWGGSDFMHKHAFWVRPSIAFLAIVMTWGFACSRYLKLPRPWLVAGLLGMVSVLAGALITILTVDSYSLFDD